MDYTVRGEEDIYLIRTDTQLWKINGLSKMKFL